MSNSENSRNPLVDELVLYLKSRVTLIVVITAEEERVIELIEEAQVRRDSDANLISWDIADRFTSAGRKKKTGYPDAPDPKAAMEKIWEMSQQSKTGDVYVLKDFHDVWKDPGHRRRLKNLSHKLKTTKSSIVVTTPHRDVPAELRDTAVVVDLDLPSVIDLQRNLDSLLKQVPETFEIKLNSTGLERLAQAAVGLSRSQAHRAFAKALVGDTALDDRDINLVLEEKKNVVRESGALEFYAPSESSDDVGGLEVLKTWLRLRERALSPEAKEYGLPAPKGVALIGIPGTGKSLTAKMIASQWRLPLLRLDVGAVFGSLVGESEEKIRQALRLAELVAPCVMWIDEIEKSLASGGLDGGTSQRVFSTILTWMQEKKKPVFVVATANDVSALPPELLRRGRFDEIFFLDLPTSEEREQIVEVHLRKRKRNPLNFDVTEIVEKSEGYVGAEIEQAIIDALYTAFDDDGRELTTSDISASLERLVPLSKSQQERISDLRNWLVDGRARSASYQEATSAIEHQVHLEFK
jgi:ATP-dependent 26S proteasome regulatory subunit